MRSGMVLLASLCLLPLIAAPALPEAPPSPRGVRGEEVFPGPAPGIGSREVPRADGGKDKIYYSVTTPEEERKAEQEEKDKNERSWDVLRNILIDQRQQR